VPVTTLVRGRAGRLLDARHKQRVAARVRVALRALGRARSSATLVFTDDDEIRALNRTFRSHDRATDVLSFHLQELRGESDPAGDGVALGDVVISVETARRRAGRARLGAELERLAIHGLCHLFGHDHKRKPEATVMFALERRLRRLPPMKLRTSNRASRGGRTTSR
jgi:probable rRNA maturation factor